MAEARRRRVGRSSEAVWQQRATELRDQLWLAPALRPRIAVSSCLLGESVRWDGGHKLDRRLLAHLADWAEPVATCPEVGIGLGVPRPPLVLQRAAPRDDASGGLRLVERDSGRDWTAALDAFAEQRLREITPLDGFVWKSRSPSCALSGVAVRASAASGSPLAPAASLASAGLFARRARSAWPLLAAVEESAFASPARAGAFRLAAEWSLVWRTAEPLAQRPGGVARLHRTLRAWWLDLDTGAVRRLDRLIALLAGAAPGSGEPSARDAATAYDRAARLELRRILARQG